MKKNLVTKIALIVAIVALLFSIVTLVRAFIIHKGILIAVIEVIGTAVIVTICSIMLYVLNTTDDEEDEEDEAEDEQDEDERMKSKKPAKKEFVQKAEKEKDITEDDIDVLLNDIDKVDDNYDLSNFEE